MSSIIFFMWWELSKLTNWWIDRSSHRGPGQLWRRAPGFRVHTWHSATSAKLNYSDFSGARTRLCSSPVHKLLSACLSLSHAHIPRRKSTQNFCGWIGTWPWAERVGSQGRKRELLFRFSPIKNAVFSHLGLNVEMYAISAHQTVSEKSLSHIFSDFLIFKGEMLQVYQKHHLNIYLNFFHICLLLWNLDKFNFFVLGNACCLQ